jgi:methionine salvage enolase-phosphatase E1
MAKIGEALKSKAGKTYLKVKKDVSLKADDVLFLSDPRDYVERLKSQGEITPEEATVRLTRIPAFHIYDIIQGTNTGNL